MAKSLVLWTPPTGNVLLEELKTERKRRIGRNRAVDDRVFADVFRERLQ